MIVPAFIRIVCLIPAFIVCVSCYNPDSSSMIRQKQRARAVFVNNTFTSGPVNDKALVFPVPAGRNTRLADLKDIPESFLPNADPKNVMIGRAYQFPAAWIYVPLVNESSCEKKMVVDVEHNRCDTLEAFLLRSGHASPLYIGKVHRTVPLADRAIPFRHFALPFNLAPHDSAALLLYSARATGIHEMSIRLSSEKYFTIKANDEEMARLFAISSAFFFLFSVCALGLIFKHRLLIHFGIYMISIVLGLLNFAYFFDAFSFPSFLGLNANSIGIFLIFTANSMLHIFSVTYLRSSGLYVRWHRYLVTMLVTANAVQMAMLLFPLSQVTNSIITEASLILTTFNIFWLFYISVLGFVRKKDKYLLITASLIFIPILYKSYVSTTPAPNYNYMQPIYYLLLFGYLIVSLFRKELTSRQITEEKIKTIQDELGRLRKSEIEQIGRNLHDQLGNTLASALGYLNMQIPNVTVSKNNDP